ncbi:v-snare coiled-coil domain-containing protein [Citrus sinensis]|uniref:V-snare coiled-coil domain-containing protein n=1 Tax=Citrus sinensis TaxID=2711 RepID=A0ACB8JVI9_CITSI|nr:v-snare coiled-coil domain-containing protein [Citrus sinensis]
MFAKRLLQKAKHNSQHGSLTAADLNLRIAVHYGIPATASILAFDHIQRLLAIATLDGRIKVIGGDGIEGLLISPSQLPYKNLEFLQNQGFLISITNDNEIQVWSLESRSLACCLKWESNITAFSVISGSHFMYIGDENGLMSVIKYDADEGKLFQLPYNISADALSGGKDLQLKDGVVDSPSEGDSTFLEGISEHQPEEKEISALCWASSSGSILAVGYIDGDILLWNTSTTASTKGQQTGSRNNVVKLELSSAERRLPVIVLHWSTNKESRSNIDGRLFVYGGDEIGSEEVLTVLSLEWSSGMENLRCVSRVDITLTGSFADMILLSSAGATVGNHKADLFVLTSPGQLHFYDNASLTTLLSQQEKKPSVCPVEFPGVIPISDPIMTVAEFMLLPFGGHSSKGLSEIATFTKLHSSHTQAGHIKWPLTGGVPSPVPITKCHSVDRVYLAGYHDGSVRIWDATYPVFKLICALDAEVQGIEVAGSRAPVSTLSFCFINSSLAVGNEFGLVYIYNLNGSLDAKNFLFVLETKSEVHALPEGKISLCRAVFSLVNSPVRALQFTSSGAKLAVGFECGRVAVLDMNLLSVLFFTDDISGSSSPIISMTWTEFKNTHSLAKNPNHSEREVPVNPAEEVIIVLFKDAKISIVGGSSENMISSSPWHLKKKVIAISMEVIEPVCGFPIEKQAEQSAEENAAKNKPTPATSSIETKSHETEHLFSSENACSGESSNDALVLLCCEDSVRLYSRKSVIQGNNKTVQKVKHKNRCCWASTIEKDEKVCGLLLLFQTGEVQIRSLPDLELVMESSLMSILRWNFKANMDKTISADNGQITLANGSEVAFVNLLAGENEFSILESSPCLHDKVLEAAAAAAFNVSSNQKKKQTTAAGILGGIVKGFKGEKMFHTLDVSIDPKSSFSQLEGIFSRPPFPDLSPAATNNEEIELNIDDIEIDEPPSMMATSSHEVTNTKKEKLSERERLLGAPDDAKPRLRTREEIIAKYRKAEDASSVAAHARDKLLERQDKLERISRRTEELQSGAEDFASLANELVKTMENRKWWKI